MSQRPNIIFVLSDQQRWDTMSYAGIVDGVTPTLDRLAEEGTLFENCFSAQPVCGPSRACLQSGRYATETGNFKNGITLPADINCVAKLMKGAGYDTAYIGKWHLMEDNKPGSERWDVPKKYRAGYDYWLCSNLLEYTSHAYDGYLFDNENQKVEIKGYRADGVTDFALAYLEKRQGDRPFFLMISHIEPHHQNDEGRVCGPKGSREKYGGYPMPDDLRNLEGNQKENFADYLGACNNLDANVRRLEEQLKKQGTWEDTIFLYSSDHGCHFKTRNGEYKRSCHDASTHVPLMAHGGPFQGGHKVTDLVSLVDIPSTILSVAGIEIPENYRGIALEKVASGEIPGREYVFSQISETKCGRCIRNKKWKYSVESGSAYDAQKHASMPYYYENDLYDLENDPYELYNLVGDESYEEVRKQLKGELLDMIWEIEQEIPEIRPFSKKPRPKKYSFEMKFREMKEDAKVEALMKKMVPFVFEPGTEGANELSFQFLAYHMDKIPQMKEALKLFAQELDKLNEEESKNETA